MCKSHLCNKYSKNYEVMDNLSLNKSIILNENDVFVDPALKIFHNISLTMIRKIREEING